MEVMIKVFNLVTNNVIILILTKDYFNKFFSFRAFEVKV